MSTRVTVINQFGHQAGWYTHRYFRRYHRRFHRAWYWLTGAFLIEGGFWLAVSGAVLSVGFLFLVLSTMVRVIQEANTR